VFPNNAASEWNGMNMTDTQFKSSAPEIIVGLFSVVFIDQQNGFPFREFHFASTNQR